MSMQGLAEGDVVAVHPGEISLGAPKQQRVHIRGDVAERLLSIFSPLLLLVLWEVLVRTSLLDARFFPPPTGIVSTFGSLVASGELWNHLSASIVRILWGFALGSTPALILGLIMGLSPIIRAAINPMIAATYPIPKIAILPLIMLIFGLGEMSKYVIVAIGVFFLVLINTMAGVMNIEQIYLDVGKNFGASRKDMYLTIAFPGALPLIFAGLRLGWGVALLLIVAAEFVGAKSGIGYLIWQSWQTFSVEAMYVGLIIISVLGYISSLVLDELERILIPWKSLHLKS
ncbi:MAG: ABC transporter permease [Chloroflexi bacterium]|nr:ABC transporter permease [Chloroflexota bacterium]MDA8189606.1 ABC transporter permease [Dehalococcoidales bacterium]